MLYSWAPENYVEKIYIINYLYLFVMHAEKFLFSFFNLNIDKPKHGSMRRSK